MGDGAIWGLGYILKQELKLILRCAAVVKSVRRALSCPVCEEDGDANASRISGAGVLDEWLRTGCITVRNRTVGNDHMCNGKYVAQRAC